MTQLIPAAPPLPGQLALLAKIESSGAIAPARYAIQRAEGILKLLPAVMHEGDVGLLKDGSIVMQWKRQDETMDVQLQMTAVSDGSFHYAYIVKGQGRAGGHLKTYQGDHEALSIVSRVVAMLTPKSKPALPNTERRS